MAIGKGKIIFSAEEKERIRKAVQKAERQTAGELATMVVDASDGYREAELLGALLLAGLVSVAIAVATLHITIWSYIPLVLILYVPSFCLFRKFPRMKLPFLSRNRIEEAVRDRAVRAFYEKGLYRTRDATGILVMISLLERKVWILGDRGINEKIAPGWWRDVARQLAVGIRENRACESLCRVIEVCGDELRKHFPRKGDDSNELSDEMLQEDRRGSF